MVNTDPYPDAPGESGSIKNMQALLGIGAYQIDDKTDGSGTSFGQNISSDFAHSLITSVAMNMGTGDGSIASAMTNLGTYLGTLSLDSLKMLQPFIPGATDADFADPATATAKIISVFNIGAMMSIEDFNNWITSIFDPNGEGWAAAKAWWDTVFAQLASYPAVGSSAATVATWWSTLLVDLGLGGTDAANIANFISGNYDAAKTAKANWDAFLTTIGLSPTQIATAIADATANWTSFMASWGVGTPADVAAATLASQAKWNAFLASIGLGSATAAGAQLAGNHTAIGTNTANISTQAAWWARLPENLLISMDQAHWFYPLGTPSDTPTTTSGGKRTWYAMKADMALMQGQTNGTSTPTVTIGMDIGTFANQTQTQVVTNEATLATVQAGLDALTSMDTSVAGRKWIVPAHGGAGASWGPDWTTAVTNANIAAKSNSDVYAMTLASSSTIDLKITGRYANTTLTNQQVVSGVFFQAAQPMASIPNGPRNTFKGRMDAAGNNYVYCRVDYNVVSIGYAVSGVEQTPWATVAGTVPAGALVELYLGSSTGDRNYQVKINGSVVLTHAEVGTSSLLTTFTGGVPVGTTYLGGGMDMLASHGTFNDTFAPAQIRQFTLKDSNVAAQTYGTSARWYRLATGAASYTTTNTITPVAGLILDTEDYRSPDIHMANGGFYFDTAGRYRIQTTVRFSSAQTLGMAMALVRATPGGPSIVSEGENYGSANMIGMEFSAEFNTVGDSGATEAFYIGLDLPGTSRSYGVIGDGVGLKTWTTITRIA